MEYIWQRGEFSVLGSCYRVLFGYRPAEQGLSALGLVPDPTFGLVRFTEDFCCNRERKVVRRSLGCNVIGFSCPSPDRYHGPSQLAGMVKRVAANMPPINRARLMDFFGFVKRFCKKHLGLLRFDQTEEFDFYDWIGEVNMPEHRRAELLEAYLRGQDRQPDLRVKAFIKDEDYDDFKHVRGIYSRTDDYKVRVGPFFKKFGDRLFSLKWFIKKIPVPDRPRAIL